MSFFVLPLFCFILVVYGLTKLIQTLTLLDMGGGPFQSPLSKDMGLKHWVLLKDLLRHTYFFSIFFWGGDPSQLGSWSEGCVKPLKISREAI